MKISGKVAEDKSALSAIAIVLFVAEDFHAYYHESLGRRPVKGAPSPWSQRFWSKQLKYLILSTGRKIWNDFTKEDQFLAFFQNTQEEYEKLAFLKIVIHFHPSHPQPKMNDASSVHLKAQGGGGGVLGGYSGFQVTGMIEWGQKSKPPKNP